MASYKSYLIVNGIVFGIGILGLIPGIIGIVKMINKTIPVLMLIGSGLIIVLTGLGFLLTRCLCCLIFYNVILIIMGLLIIALGFCCVFAKKIINEQQEAIAGFNAFSFLTGFGIVVLCLGGMCIVLSVLSCCCIRKEEFMKRSDVYVDQIGTNQPLMLSSPSGRV